MIDETAIREHMEVIGADGVHVGTVDRVEGDRIKLTRSDSFAGIEGATGSHEGHHHFISTGLVAHVEGYRVRLSTTAANAVNFTQEDGEEGDVAPDGQDFEIEEQGGFGEEAIH